MISVQRIRKTFDAAVAVDDVSLGIEPGEITGLAGENGAGKTTLMSVVAGELRPDSGSISGIDPTEIGFVHQHFMIVPELTVAENLVLAGGTTAHPPRALDFLSRRKQFSMAERMIEESGLSLPELNRRAGTLSVGERSRLELIKAIARRPRLLILDEPTSVLTPGEAADLFTVMRTLASRGSSVVFISHKIPEILAVASRVVVMRRGRLVLDASVASTSGNALADAMVGVTSRPPSPASAPPALAGAIPPQGEPAMSSISVSGELLDQVSFDVARGEIVAIIGVAGNGQSELALIAQKLVEPRSGTFRTGGASTFIPEDRTRDGVIAEMTIAENLALTESRWRPREAEARANRLIESYDIRARSPRQPAGSLSGGNQQKVLLARALDRHPAVLVASEPTRGLDFEATRFVHEQLRAAAASGAGILLITSDLDEAFALADSVHVIYRGRLSERLTPSQAQSRAPSLMAGLG